MALDLEKMKARLNNLQNKGGRSSLFWRPDDGEQTVRIVPTGDGDPFKDYFFHYNVGSAASFICPKRNFGDDCPVCSFVSTLFKKEDDDSVQTAKSLMAKQRFFSPVLVRGEEDEGVRVWGYGKTVYESLLNLVLNPDYGDITDVDKGIDFILHYGKPPGASFPVTKLQPRRKSTPLLESAEAIEEALGSVSDFTKLFERKTTEEVGAYLDAYLDGPSEDDDDKEEMQYGKDEKAVDKAFKELSDE